MENFLFRKNIFSSAVLFVTGALSLGLASTTAWAYGDPEVSGSVDIHIGTPGGGAVAPAAPVYVPAPVYGRPVVYERPVTVERPVAYRGERREDERRREIARREHARREHEERHDRGNQGDHDDRGEHNGWRHG